MLCNEAPKMKLSRFAKEEVILWKYVVKVKYGGESWQVEEKGLLISRCRDLEIHSVANILVFAEF